MRVRRIRARTQSISQLRIQSMLPQVTFEAAASLLVSGPEPWDSRASAPTRALTPWRRFGSLRGVLWVLTRHTANAERARDAQPEPVARGGSSDGIVGCTAQADPNSGQTKREARSPT